MPSPAGDPANLRVEPPGYLRAPPVREKTRT